MKTDQDQGKRQSAEQTAVLTQYAVGIDPGATGAVVILEAETKQCVFVADFEEDLVGISLFLKAHRPSFAVVERQQYMAKGGRAQGAKSAFSLGENYGLWKGLLQGLDVPFQTVPPIAWQKYVFGSGTVCGDTKERSIRMAMRLLPDLPLVPEGSRTQRHGRSDAGLLALYAAAVIRKRGALKNCSQDGNRQIQCPRCGKINYYECEECGTKYDEMGKEIEGDGSWAEMTL